MAAIVSSGGTRRRSGYQRGPRLRYLDLMCLVFMLAGCASPFPRCEGSLEPINLPGDRGGRNEGGTATPESAEVSPRSASSATIARDFGSARANSRTESKDARRKPRPAGQGSV